MKITLVGTLPPIKALSPYCFHLAEALSEKTDVEFINFKDSLPEIFYSGGMKAEEDNEYRIKNVKIENILSWWNPFSWMKAGFDAKGDIIHAQHWAIYSGAIYSFILPIAKVRGKKRILSVHNITPHVHDRVTVALDRFINKLIFPFADILVVHNTRNKDKLIELYGVDEKKIAVITHGTLHTYHQALGISQQQAREHFHIPQDKKIILFFGYIWGYKGLDILLQSLSLVKKEQQDIAVFIAGQPLKDWKTYENLIRDLDLDNEVFKNLSYISDQDVELCFSCADLVVLPYKKESFDTHGGVGALALSFGKPMIVSDVGGLPEYVKDKRTIVQSGNVEELASRIILVLNDAVLLKKLSKDSEELARELSWDKIADRTIAAYHVALQKVSEA